MVSATVKRNNVICAVLILLLVCIAAGSLAVGKYPLSLEKLLAGDEMQRKVFYNLRMSRTVVAVFGGAVLGICGFVYQTVFRNPLASPDIIGVSSGASLGAAVGILCFGSAAAITASAFAGAVLSVCLALLLSSADKTGKKSTIVLAGIAVHALAQTALMCLKITADPERELASIEYWIMGSLASVTSSRIGGNLLICILITIVLLFLHRQTILLSADEGEARMLGVSVSQVRLIVLLLATLAVSAVVSLTGLISFIGLLAPHIARLITRSNRISTMVFSGLTGGILLCSADILARSVAQTELPVSIFTSLIGVPLLIFLTLKGRNMS
ncbi:MAG: iron ABC transporter permease [Oscillospiraceae bacterium]|nr:iron ABC transporter permease [Oscillospiraceae bacterium]